MTDRDLQQRRYIAAGIDIAVAIAIGIVFAVVGGVLGFAFSSATSTSMVGVYLPRVISFLGSLVSLAYILGRDILAGGEEDLVYGAGGDGLDRHGGIRRHGARQGHVVGDGAQGHRHLRFDDLAGRLGRVEGLCGVGEERQLHQGHGDRGDHQQPEDRKDPFAHHIH